MYLARTRLSGQAACQKLDVDQTGFRGGLRRGTCSKRLGSGDKGLGRDVTLVAVCVLRGVSRGETEAEGESRSPERFHFSHRQARR